MSDYEDSFGSAEASREAPPALPPAPADDDPLSILDRLQSYKAGAGLSFGRAASPSPRDSGSGKEAASYTTYTADSDHESRASSVASAKHTPRAVKATPGAATLASSAVAQYTGAAKPAVTFGAPIAPADLSSHTEHYSEASVTPPRPAAPGVEVTRTTIRRRNKAGHVEEAPAPSRSRSRSRSRSKERPHSRGSSRSHTHSHTHQKSHSRERKHAHTHEGGHTHSGVSRAAYNDVVMGAVGGVLLTPAPAPPHRHVEELAFRQALGLTHLGVPVLPHLGAQGMVVGVPSHRQHTQAHTHFAAHDSVTDTNASEVSVSETDESSNAVMAPNKDAELLELLLRLAILEAQEKPPVAAPPAPVPAPSPPKPPAPIAATPAVSPAVSRAASPPTRQPVKLHIPPPALPELAPDEAEFLSSRHPSLTTRLAALYGGAAGAALTHLQDSSLGDAEVRSALASAFEEVLCDPAVVSVITQAVVAKLMTSYEQAQGITSDRPLPRSLRHDAGLDADLDRMMIPAFIRSSPHPEGTGMGRGRHLVPRNARKSFRKASRSRSRSRSPAPGPDVVILPVYQSLDSLRPRSAQPARYGNAGAASAGSRTPKSSSHAQLLRPPRPQARERTPTLTHTCNSGSRSQSPQPARVHSPQ